MNKKEWDRDIEKSLEETYCPDIKTNLMSGKIEGRKQNV